MNRRIMIIVSCALTLSLCVGYLVYRAVGARANTGRPLQTTPVIVAARDLEAGTLIRGGEVKTVAWPGPRPGGSVAKPDSLLNRSVSYPIYEGEPVTEPRLAPQGSGGGLAGIIPPGMRACAVKVNEVVGVAGFVVSGMRVDVLVTGQAPGGNPLEGPRVRTLLQNIQVLSAGTNFHKDQEGKPEQAQVVNLLVTPAQAEILSLASNETRIQLVLRNPMDTGIAKPPGTMVSDLLGVSRPPEAVPSSSARRNETSVPQPVMPLVPAPVASNPYVVEVLNGAVHTRSTFSRAAVRQ
jgi:pilus assembly protein CpaB